MKNISSIDFMVNLRDDVHPLQGLSSITDFSNEGGLDDVKRKGIMSEIVRRLTKVEEDIRKLKSRG